MNKKTSILLVDSEECIRSVYSELLKDAGFEVQTAVSGRDVLHNFTEPYPDMVITDVINPDMNGLYFAGALRKLRYTGLIIIFSGEEKEELVDLSKKLGINVSAVFEKTADINKMIKEIVNLAQVEQPA
ncbi:MAG: response regulator [Candidatus Veblenbacteria bacterium]|nr:response regulator [Candidatus Veblenbacteria bacterium]